MLLCSSVISLLALAICPMLKGLNNEIIRKYTYLYPLHITHSFTEFFFFFFFLMFWGVEAWKGYLWRGQYVLSLGKQGGDPS